MDAQDLWSQLSMSSKRALQWAGALARIRAEQTGHDPSSAAADSHDILVGMMLEHPRDSEPAVLLRHFRFVPGNVLPMDYPRPTSEALERHLAALPSNQAPPLDPEDAAPIVAEGVNIGMRSGSSKVAELRALFAAMLEMPNRTATTLSELLERRGTDLTVVKDTTVQYVMDPKIDQSYASLLSERHPYRPEPINIANYKADHGQTADLANDLINIRAEVDAFAYLLASRGLHPPMAVGLFGDWGSGKSFFMEAVRRRIDQLISNPDIHQQPQSKVPFWKRVVQIRFNAWHYVEGELWASLVDHIFSQLRLVYDGDDESIVEKRRKHWLEKLDSARVRLARLETQRSAAQRELRETQHQAELLRQRRDDEIERLKMLKSESVEREVLKAESIKAVREIVSPLLMSAGERSPQAALEKLEEARAELRRARMLVGSLWQRPGALAVSIVSLIAVPVLVWLLTWLDVSAVASAFAGLSAVAGAGLGLLRNANRRMQDQLDKIADAEAKVRQDMEQARQAWSKKIQEAENNAQAAEENLSGLREKEAELTEQLQNVQKKLDEVSPAVVLNEFVTERVGSGDYRKRLGVPALIQNDFEQLARLICEQNEEYLAKDGGDSPEDPNRFNRIILYIDDLDRCPEKHVVEVLQAVHLLLAFELFVVVVAVDSRWLNHALVKHFPALADETVGPNHATPDDYLEKIFQIPFWVEPLDDDARRNIVQGLLRGHVAGGPAAAQEDDHGEKPSVGDAQREILQTLNPASAPPVLDAAALTITPEELRFLEELVPLLGETPRSVKRFVNLYQLLRIIQRSSPPDEQPGQPPHEQLTAFVLAVGNGIPGVGPKFMDRLRTAAGGQTLQDVLADLAETDGTGAEYQQLSDWLASQPHWQQIPVSRLATVTATVERFLFRVGAR